ncbi:MAG: hypothetical protein AAF721_11670 [Myxococcota bacterium]
MTSEFDECIERATEQLDASNPPAAFAALRPVFGDAALSDDAPRLARALEVLAAIATPIAGPEFAALVGRAAANPHDPAVLHAVGYECLEQQLRWPAICVLRRAVALGPGEAPLLRELVIALEADGRHAMAVASLRAAPELLRTHFELRYLHAFNALMAGSLAEGAARLSELGEPGDAQQVEMAQRLDAMHSRANAAGRVTTLDDTDLRGWHFVTSGGLLLHVSPFGHADGMNGRYAMTQDSAARCRKGLLRLHAVLDEWEQIPERVLLLPDRDSHVLGMAAAAMYGVPAEPFEEGTPGVIVAYDLSTLDRSTPAAVARHHADQLLFAHATCWTDPPPCVPDLTTYLYQVNVPLSFDSGPGSTAPPALVDPDDPTVEVAVQSILDAIVDDEADDLPTDTLPAVVTFANEVRPLTAAARSDGLRAPMLEGGPVRSTRL